MCLQIIARESWKAERPRTTQILNNLILPVVNVVITYTNTVPCETGLSCRSAINALQHKAIRLKFQEDIYYNFVIGGDGKVYEGRGWWTCPMLPYRYRYNNKDSIYIAFMGKFLDKRPPEHMRKARFELIQYGLTMNLIAENYERRDISSEIEARKETLRTRQLPNQHDRNFNNLSSW